MRYILLTTSPFQFLNALLYSVDDANPELCLVVDERLYGSYELRQLVFLKTLFGVETDKLYSRFWFSHLLQIYRKLGSRDQIVVFGPNNHWSAFLAAFLPVGKLLIVDDGAHALSSAGASQVNNSFKDWCLTVLYDLFAYLISKKDVERFSLFPSQSKFKVSVPDYKKLSALHRASSLDYHFEDKAILFVGTPISEAGVISLETEVSAVAKAILFHRSSVDNEGYRFIYVAHRRDCTEKLSKIRNKGVEVVKLSGPLELYLAESLVNSEIKVCSITSTVLFTALNMGYERLNLTCVDIPEASFLKEYKEKYEQIYKAFEDSGFAFIR